MSVVWRPREQPTQFAALELRDMRLADLDQVVAIEQSAYAFPWTYGNFRDSIAAGYTTFSVLWHGALVGYAVIMFAVDEAHLLNIAVAPAMQGKGFGRRVLEHVIACAKERAVILYLEVRPSNTVARELYARLGFRQLAIRPGYYPALTGREDALFLSLSLNNAPNAASNAPHPASGHH
jgi:[ribosomal protein S18]-alanine N-acetyltransferase